MRSEIAKWEDLKDNIFDYLGDEGLEITKNLSVTSHLSKLFYNYLDSIDSNQSVERLIEKLKEANMLDMEIEYES